MRTHDLLLATHKDPDCIFRLAREQAVNERIERVTRAYTRNSSPSVHICNNHLFMPDNVKHGLLGLCPAITG